MEWTLQKATTIHRRPAAKLVFACGSPTPLDDWLPPAKSTVSFLRRQMAGRTEAAAYRQS
jgi:hypothetical protein